MLHDILLTFLIVGAITVLFYSGYVCGYWNGWKKAEAAHERLLRLEPPDRTPGTPANLDADPSTPRSPQWRSGRIDGESHM